MAKKVSKKEIKALDKERIAIAKRIRQIGKEIKNSPSNNLQKGRGKALLEENYALAQKLFVLWNKLREVNERF